MRTLSNDCKLNTHLVSSLVIIVFFSLCMWEKLRTLSNDCKRNAHSLSLLVLTFFANACGVRVRVLVGMAPGFLGINIGDVFCIRKSATVVIPELEVMSGCDDFSTMLIQTRSWQQLSARGSALYLRIMHSSDHSARCDSWVFCFASERSNRLEALSGRLAQTRFNRPT